MSTLWKSKLAYLALMAFAAGLVLALPVTARAVGDEPPPDLKKLEAECQQAYESGNYKKALEAAEKINELKPDDSDNLYNIACLHCLLGDKAKAYEWLEKAIDAGFSDADHLAADDDFKTIRAEDRFRAIVKRLREPEAKVAEKKGAKEQEKGKGKKESEKKEAEKKEEQKKEKKAAKNEQPEKPAKPEKPEKPEKPAKPEKPDKSMKYQLTEQQVGQRVQELTQQLIEAAQAKDNWKALSLALEARVLADVGLTNYNVACMYSLLGKKDEAIRYLERGVVLGGFTNDMAGQMEGDSDLDNIRKDPRYAELLKKAGGKEAKPGPAQGKQVDAEWRVTVPKGFDKTKKAPLIVALHEEEGNMDSAIKNWKKAAEEMGAILLTPQGTFRPSEDHFQWGRNLDPVEENIMDAIDGVMEDYAVDKKKIVIVGFGQGGTVAYTLALRNPDIFRGAVPIAAAPADKWEGDIDRGAIKGLRVFTMMGADDDEKLIKQNQDLVPRLKKLGIKVELKVIDDLGHEFPKKAAAEELKALKYVLGE